MPSETNSETVEAAPRRRRFFDDSISESDLTLPPGSVRASAATYDSPRGMTAATEVLDLKKANKNLIDRSVAAWQDSAWNFVDQIGELKFAFNLVAQVVSRAFLYPAMVAEHSEIPVATDVYLDDLDEKSGEASPDHTKKALEIAEEVVRELVDSGQAEILRLFALNLSIPGECYLLNDKEWTVASISEFTPGSTPYLNRHKDSKHRRALKSDTYAARIWRAHPRWYAEPDSSMLGVLDQCEKVILMDQVMRALSRSRLNAGVIVVPNGLTPIVEDMTLSEALAKTTIDPVESEVAGASVTPLVLQGPAEQIEKLQYIELGRKIDADMLAAYDQALDRMLGGVDIPKDIVSGLADVKYANALVIDDALYKAHIEPLLLLICDALTSAYLRPRLLKEGVDPQIVKRLVIWYNPSQIVTRPDRSQAASEGYEKFLLSGQAWRSARGFSEMDAPGEDEIITRLGLAAQVPPEMATVLIEALNPEFFQEKRNQNQEAAGVPEEVSDLLSGDDRVENPGEVPSEGEDQESGGDITPGGTLPPVQSEVSEMLR